LIGSVLVLNQEVKGKVENSLTVLLVSDLEKSKSYYQEALGCEVTEWWATENQNY
jgi:catechol-2,3-dioxygenase